jgi:sporulation protein YlmC with PRC-barrel domain
MPTYRSRLVYSLCVTAVSWALAGQSQAQVGAGTDRRSPPSAVEPKAKPRQLATGLIGAEVRDKQGEKIGEVSDFVIVGNQIETVALAVGGVLGVGDRHVALPYEQLRSIDDGAFAIGLDKESVQALPTFDSPAAAPDTHTGARDSHTGVPVTPPPAREPLAVDPELAEIDPRLGKGIAENEAAFDEPVDHESFDNDEE